MTTTKEAPNRYWKVMTTKEQRQRLGGMTAQEKRIKEIEERNAEWLKSQQPAKVMTMEERQEALIAEAKKNLKEYQEEKAKRQELHSAAVRKAAVRAKEARAKEEQRIKQIEESNVEWLKSQQQAEAKPDLVDQLFDIPNLIAVAVVVGICWGFMAVMSTPGGSAVVVCAVGFGIVCSFLNGAGKSNY